MVFSISVPSSRHGIQPCPSLQHGTGNLLYSLTPPPPIMVSIRSSRKHREIYFRISKYYSTHRISINVQRKLTTYYYLRLFLVYVRDEKKRKEKKRANREVVKKDHF
jgi:hypothetical protein